jgi:DNA polymerase I
LIAPQKTRPRLYLIDGYALIYRAFFAMISRPLTTSRGENTSAAFGVTRFLRKVLDEHRPDYLGVVFDAGTSERNELYADYKATREKMPDELEASLPRVRQLIEAFGVPVLELAGYEADDVIGTLAEIAGPHGLETVIVSGDKDFYQLIRDGVCLLNPGRGGSGPVEEEWVDLRNAAQRLGVPPERVVDYLALIGDSSDNVPGVRGIGPKTAVELIERFGPVEEILARRGEITAKRAREALEAHAEAALLSKRLVTIRTDLPVELDLEALRCEAPDRAALARLFTELEFHSLAREFAEAAAEQGAPAAPSRDEARDYRVVDSVEEARALAARIREWGRVSLDTETTSTDPLRADLIGLGLCVKPGEAWYLPFGHCLPGGDQGELGGGEREAPRNLPAIPCSELDDLVRLLEDPAVEKIGQNLKYDLLVLRRAGISLRGVAFDTMVASYVLDPGRREHGLDALALQHLNLTTTSYQDVTGKGKAQIPFAEVEVGAACDYCCEDADVALRLAERFAPELERLGLEHLFRTVEIPLIEVLAEMEWAGIRIDAHFFRDFGRTLQAERAAVEKEIHAEAGVEFNINSNPQLREILFERLGLPVRKRTKTGASTDHTVLEQLAAEGFRLPELLLEYRHLDKLQSTYVDALPRMVNPQTGRIHTSFNQTVAATGRLSSTDPNLQNIPIRTARGAEIRRGFVPAEGNLFVSADYSQIELRILAHYSGDAAFVEAFRSGADIHRQTAALMFGVPVEEVTREMRDRAKTVNFAIIYGVGSYSLAGQLGVPVAEAKEFIERYFERFPGVRSYLDEQIERARDQGFVETLTGRRRYIPEIRSSNFNIRSFGERAATNAPIQGSSADLIKIAMIEIHRFLQAEPHRGRMLVQVHDELLFEVAEEGADTLVEEVRARMEGAAELRVPLKVEAGRGRNWLECK